MRSLAPSSARWRVGVSTAILALCSLAGAEIRYTVRLSSDATKLLVTMDVPVPRGVKDLTFQSPRWGPGSYDYSDFGKQINDVDAKDAKGAELTVAHPDFSTWTIAKPPAGRVTVSYDVKADDTNDVLEYSGPATYLYVAGRKQEPCSVTIDVPAGWPIAVGLNNAAGKTNTFVAPTYDVLADNPVSAGKYYADTYTSAGSQFYIALRGAPEDVAAIDKVKLHKITKFIADMETNFWGGAPYDHYVWHFVAFKRPDGGWGLEHLASTQIGLATGFGPGTDGVLSHEFFHAWNVKRIRSQPLGPFNYQELPQTGALWWLEGVTDYYAHTLLRRYGWTDDPRFYHVIATQVSAVRGNDKRFEISPYDSSYRVRDANNGRGNSNGYEVSYYNTGWLVGLCLDMAIRGKTANKKSLDDVAHNLFKKYGHGQPGFPEDGIRTELVNVGGSSMGDMYDHIVTKPGELPVEDALAKVGLTLSQSDEQYAKLGFRTRPNQEANGLDVLEPDASTGLKAGDLIVGINGQMFAGKTMMQVFTTLMAPVNSPEIGRVIHLSIKRSGSADLVAVDVTPAAATRKVWAVTESPSATPAQIALRKSWLSPPKNWPPQATR